jgi:predicted DCC family thiol-disulfide oxidoreductase YuxK
MQFITIAASFAPSPFTPPRFVPGVSSAAAHGTTPRAIVHATAVVEGAGRPLPREIEQLRVLYDGTCSVCSTNVALLSFFDRRKERLKFVDISAKTYLPEANAGVSYEEAMQHIYVIGPAQQVQTGADAVLTAYESVGLGWLVWLFRTPLLRWLVEVLYSFVSRHRHSLSRFVPGGRRITSFVNTLHQVDAAAQGFGCDDEEECELPYDDDDE